MESSYKRLGDFIRLVDLRNTELKVKTLLGVSIEKKFIPSIANTIGTDMKSYKIVKKGQFAYGTVTSRNGDKVSIALLKDYEECIISSAYLVFEIIDERQLNPDYLMMLFSNPEFDRYARYNSWGSAREVFSWDDLCRTEMSIPSIEEQEKIVRWYKTIEDRIDLLKNEDYTLLNIIKNIMLEHRSKHSDYLSIGEYCTRITSGGTPSRTNNSYWNSRDIPWLKNGEVKNNIVIETEEYISKKGLNESSAKIIKKHSVLMAMYCVSEPQVSINEIETTTNQAICCMETTSLKDSSYLCAYLMTFGRDLTKDANGAAQQNLNQEQIKEFRIVKPDNVIKHNLEIIFLRRICLAKELNLLNKTKNALLFNI